MSFTKSSRNISITPDFVLSAECRGFDGAWKRSSVRLDPFLGNADGAFLVGTQDFTKSAKDVFVREDGGSTILHATLRKCDQTWQESSFNLDIVVSNMNGELRIDTAAVIGPEDGVVDWGALETLIADCGQTVSHLQDQIQGRLAHEAHAALQSVNTAFRGMEQTQDALSDAAAYAIPQDFGQQAAHLRFLFADAMGQWSAMGDAVAGASQQIKEFQQTKLHAAVAEIEAAERRIAAEVDGTRLRQKEAREQLASLCAQIQQHRKAHSTASRQRNDANARTIGFSVASAFVPFVFIPLAVMSSKEREDWDRSKNGLQDSIRQASCERDRLEGLQLRLERALRAAGRSSDKCRHLRAETGRLSDELRGLEERIHEMKCRMTAYSQALAEAETSGVTAFQYSQTVQEGREILDEALRVREDLVETEKLHILLEM